MNGILLAAGYFVALALYRLAFHPLRRFPGPRLASLTSFYRTFYDVFRGGGWMYQVKELHDVYGPIVRVSPNELHFSDPDAYEDIHAISKCNKYRKYYGAFTPNALVSTCDPQEASKKRIKLGSYFSRRAVIQLESTVQKTVDRLIERLASYTNWGKPADLFFAYRSATLNIITTYLFSQESDALDYPDFQSPHLYQMDEMLVNGYSLRFIPYLQWAIMKLPERLVRTLIPATGPQLDQINFLNRKIDEFTANPPSTDDAAIFDTWLRRDLSDGGKDNNPWTASRVEIIDECTSLQFAGSDTVGNACMIGSYHLLKCPEVLKKLRKEIDEAWPDIDSVMSYESLEKLPYLTAVIKESLRLSHGVASPLPRITGPAGAVITGQFIPSNTAVSCGSYIVHNNPTIFPDPTQFRPERWIGESGKALEKYLVSFSRGPRLCIGINLGWCELYLIFANVFRKLELEMFDTTDEDLKWGDYFLPVYPPKHLRAFVKATRAM